nr:hypothetical protein [Tanacetum cinerariifolium]
MEKEDMKLIEQSIEFLKSISITNNDEDCNILSEAREKVNGVYRDLPDKISSNTDLAYFIIQDSKSAVMKELNVVCDKLSDLSIKAGIQDYVASLQDDDDYTSDDDAADVDVDDDDDDDDVYDDDGEISVYLKKRYILALEIKHYDQTLEFMSELATTAGKERVVEYDHDHLLLIKAYHAIKTVHDALSRTSDVAPNNNIFFSEITTTEQKSKSCSGEAESGSGGCKSPIDIPENHEANDELGDIDYHYHYPNKCMEEQDERCYPRVIRIGNWDPKYEGQGISLLDPSALRDYSVDELDLANLSEGSPNIHLLDELLASMSKGRPKFHPEDELDSTNMSEGSPKVHPEDELIMRE